MDAPLPSERATRFARALRGERRGRLGGALLLAGVATATLIPFAQPLVSRGATPVTAVMVLFMVTWLGAFWAISAIDRAARRDLDRLEAMRAGRARRAERFGGVPLPFALEADVFAGIVAAELAALPAWIGERLERDGVGIAVDDELPGEPHVLGLYERRPIGIGIGGRGDVDARITLYRVPLIRHARAEAALPDAVRATLLHEIGHAFGMDEGDLDRYDIGNHPLPDAIPVRRR